MTKIIDVALWAPALVAFVGSVILAWIALITWGEWRGFPLVIRTAYLADFLVCLFLLIRAASAFSLRERMISKLVVIATGPIMFTFAGWANS